MEALILVAGVVAFLAVAAIPIVLLLDLLVAALVSAFFADPPDGID